jgi:hypothetical protein
VAPVDQPDGLGQRALLAGRIAVVRGDTHVVALGGNGAGDGHTG